MKNHNIVSEAADSIASHLKHSNTHTLTSKEIAELLPGLTQAEVTSVIRYLLDKRIIKHLLGRFVYNYDRQVHQRNLIHINLASVERAASMCMTLPPVDWLNIFGGDLDQNELTVFKQLAAPIIKGWEETYYTRQARGHFDNLPKRSLFA